MELHPSADALRAEIQALSRMRDAQVEAILSKISDGKELTDAKFVTFRALLEGNAEKVALALAAADKAVSKAETATEKRFEAVNEFRSALNDATTASVAAAANFVTREMLDDRLNALDRESRAHLESIHQRLSSMEKSQANMAGRFAIIGVVVTFVLTLVIVAATALSRGI